jgi:hypothetical protein
MSYALLLKAGVRRDMDRLPKSDITRIDAAMTTGESSR